MEYFEIPKTKLFELGKRHGEFVLTWSDGDKFQQTFEHGRLVTSRMGIPKKLKTEGGGQRYVFL